MVGKKVEIVDYDPEWPRTFEALKRLLVEQLGELALAVEHVGSTSVPGLQAKPIIDLDIVIASRDDLDELIRRLARLGYFYEGDLGVSGREAFGREAEDVPRDGTGQLWPRHHLYVCARDNRELARHLVFRDYLRQHPDQVRAYAQLKRRLAEQYSYDADAYTKAKTEFIENALRQQQ